MKLRVVVYPFGCGIPAAFGTLRTNAFFPWRTTRVERLASNSYSKIFIHEDHDVYTLFGPDGKRLRLDSEMCKNVIHLGPQIVADVKRHRAGRDCVFAAERVIAARQPAR